MRALCVFLCAHSGVRGCVCVQCVSMHMDTLEWLDRGWGISEEGKREETEEDMCALSQGVFEK